VKIKEDKSTYRREASIMRAMVYIVDDDLYCVSRMWVMVDVDVYFGLI
jgi:hypothetical protein